ncbi:hypothetical protein ACJMK2_022186 [Sinanodonta woodiana]|uniref:Uncharacterized protein n=1 Tax=Sinanodonta woodiana TaxID=1069815 RepID=A0ABD3TI87_SINWO
MKMSNTDSVDPSQCNDVPLETGSGFTVIAQLESNREGSHASSFETISDHRKPASFLDPEGSTFNYETLARNVYVYSSNPNSNIDYDGYEHLNIVKERRDDNLKGNIYDIVQYE